MNKHSDQSALLERIDVELGNDYLFLMWSWEDAIYASLEAHFGRYELTSDVTQAGTPPSRDVGYRGGGLVLLVEFFPKNKSAKKEFIGLFQSEDEAIIAARSHYYEFLMLLKKRVTCPSGA